MDYTSRFLIVCKQADTLISDNGPCYTLRAFTSLKQPFNVSHISSSPHYPQSNGLAEKYVQIVKCLFNKAKEEGTDFHKCLMIYHITPLTGSLQMPVQILHGRSTRSDLPMSNAARNKLGFKPYVLRNVNKHEKLPTHDPHIGQLVMYQDSASKQWHPAIITSLCQEKQSYNVKTSYSVIYWKTQAHLKLYTPHNKMAQPMPQPMAQPEHNQALSDCKPPQITTSHLRRDINDPVKLDLLVLCAIIRI